MTDQTIADEVWLNIEQARELASVTRRTIYNWMDKGRLTTKRTAGGAVRILESSLWRPAQERYVETVTKRIESEVFPR